jgi:hypothetical protein
MALAERTLDRRERPSVPPGNRLARLQFALSLLTGIRE